MFWRMQSGGMTCLDDEGMAEIEKLMDYYLENAKILKEVVRFFMLYLFWSRCLVFFVGARIDFEHAASMLSTRR